MSMKCPPIYSFIWVCVDFFLIKNLIIARQVATSLNFTLRSIESDDSIPDDELQSMNGSDGQQAGRHAIPTGNFSRFQNRLVGFHPQLTHSPLFLRISPMCFFWLKKRCDT